MKIRAEQMLSLGEDSLRRFQQRMAAHLRERFPSETGSLSDGELSARIRDGNQKAKCYGLATEPQTCAYLELDVMYGPDFDTGAKTTWAGKILRNHRLTGDDKLKSLEDHELFSR